MTSPCIKIDVFSDLACPWCYIGKRRLDKAIQAFSSRATFALHWHPYMIDTATNPKGEDYTAYNVQRWGGDGWTAQLRRSGKPDGALFASWKTWPNTLHAHRLAEHAQRTGKGCQAQDKLFERIYELGGNVSDKSILLQVANDLQLDDADAFLQSDAGLEEVIAADADAKQRNVRSVPFFLIGAENLNNRHALSGAQQTDAYLAVFAKAAAEARAQAH